MINCGAENPTTKSQRHRDIKLVFLFEHCGHPNQCPCTLLDSMEITRTLVADRDRALLGGDYASYHKQTTRTVQNLRRRLGVATPKGRKYTAKATITAGNVAAKPE